MAQLPRTIRTGLSRRFVNKPTGPYDAGAHKTFPTAEVSLDELARHITAGYAFAVACYADGHRKKANFQSAQLLALDLDDGVSVDEAAADPFVSCYAWLVYPTPSSTPEKPKTRVVFVLAEPVDDCGRWEALQRAVIRHCSHLRPDPTAADGARQFYGSNKPGWRILGQALPLAIAGALAVDEAAEDLQRAEEAARRPAPKPISGDRETRRAAGLAAAALDRIFAELLSAPAGQRHHLLLKLATKAYTWIDWPGVDDGTLTARLTAIVESWPNAYEHRRTLQDARRYGLAHPRPVELPPDDNPPPGRGRRRQRGAQMGPRPEATYGADPGPFEPNAPENHDTHAEAARGLIQIAAHRTIEAEYVTAADLLSAPTVALRSAVGTGKTTAIIEVFRQAEAAGQRAAYFTHREQLAANFTTKAEAAGVDIHHYKNVSDLSQLRIPPRLAVCVNTYAMLADPNGEGLPTYETVIVDEWEQLLDHLYLPNDTLGKAEQPHTAEALAIAIRKARRVIAVDATLSAAGIAYLRQLRPDLQVIDNLRRPERGPLIMHDKRAETIDALKTHAADLGPGETIAVAMASRERAELLAEELTPIVGAANLLLLSANTKGEERPAAFLRDPNGQTARYRLIIYTPVIGTGYDVTAPVVATYALIDGPNVPPEDARQLIGRFRRAGATHVWMPDTDPEAANPEEMDAELIEQNLYAKARRSRLLLSATIGADGRLAYSPTQIRYIAEFARRQARRHTSRAYLRPLFAALAAEYTISYRAGKADPEAARLRRQLAEERDARLRQLALTAEPVDYFKYEEARRAGVVTEEITAGHRRHLIERTARQAITAAIRDQLWTDRARRALQLYTDQFDDYAEVALVDNLEAVQTEPNEPPQDTAARERLFAGVDAQPNIPINRRQYRIQKYTIGRAALKTVVSLDTLQPAAPRERADMEAAALAFVAEHGEDLRLIMRWARTRVPTPIAQLRAALALIGIPLRRRTVRTGNSTPSVWFVDAEELQAWHALAVHRLAELLAERARKRVEKLQGEKLITHPARTPQPAYRVPISPLSAKTQQAPPASAPIGERNGMQAVGDLLDELIRPTILSPRRSAYAY